MKENQTPRLNMCSSIGFLMAHREGGVSQELADLFHRWDKFHATGLRGSLIDICIPVDRENAEHPVALKVINPYSYQIHTIQRRVSKWATVSQIEEASSLVASVVPVAQMSAALEEQRQMAALLALEHVQYEQLYAPYVLPSVFVGFIPQVDVIEPSPSAMDSAEKEQRMAAGALTGEGRRIILQKGVPAFAMVQDYFFPTIPLAKGMGQTQKDQLRHLITLFELGFEKGFYPDPGIADPERGNAVFVGGDKLVLIDTNYLLPSNEPMAKKYFNQVLDSLYYLSG